ncbi:amino acid permease [Colletotrichum asianum]|uniref:Amino acid permease n=1 Tax=Colletotrichum asianum TaxID=702518 RepID=A0A8H3WNR4_9PEZI|nr:amino acid permease [Colletotrichum asianum]
MDLRNKSEIIEDPAAEHRPRGSVEGTAIIDPSSNLRQPQQFQQRFNLWSAVAMGVCIAGTMYWALLTIHLLVNIFGVKLFSLINFGAAFIHLSFLFITMIVLLATTENKNSAQSVFVEFQNTSGWPTDGIAFWVGIITACAGFGGIHSVVMFSQETRDAANNIPRALLYSLIINALLCLPWVLALLFCTGSLDLLLQSPVSFVSPMAQIYLNSTENVSVAIFLQVMTFTVGAGASMNLIGSAGRAIHSAALDGALPPVLSKIHPKWNVPVRALLVTFVALCLICLIYIWNTTAFFAFLSAFLILQMVSYIVPIGLLMYRSIGKEFELGPWQIGRFRVIVHTMSLVWCALLIVFPSFPTTLPVKASNMNYSIVIVTGIFAFATVLYFAYARGRFTGLKLETLVGIRAGEK